MGKSHTIFKPMPGEETALILIVNLHPESAFQRHTYTPFRTTLPGRVTYLWKSQYRTHRQRALRTSQESPSRISSGGRRRAVVKRKPPGQRGAAGGRGEARARGGEGSGGQVWLLTGWSGLEKVRALTRQPGAVQLFSSTEIRNRVPWTEEAVANAAPAAAASAAQAANNSCSRRRRPEEGREEERQEGGTAAEQHAPCALVLGTWGAQERVFATTTVERAPSCSVTPPADRAPSR